MFGMEDKVIQEDVITNLTLLTDKMDVDESHTSFETVQLSQFSEHFKET